MADTLNIFGTEYTGVTGIIATTPSETDLTYIRPQGTRLYVDGAGYGTENTTWTNNQQNTHLSNISLTVGDKLRVYGRNTRGTSYYICAPMLAIVEA